MTDVGEKKTRKMDRPRDDYSESMNAFYQVDAFLRNRIQGSRMYARSKDKRVAKTGKQQQGAPAAKTGESKGLTSIRTPDIRNQIKGRQKGVNEES